MDIIYYDFDDCVVDGKKISEWVIDEGDELRDDLKPFESALKNPDKNPIGMFDLGKYVVDYGVRVTDYVNGVDLARLTGTFYHHEAYDAQMSITCIDGCDVYNIAKNNVENYSIEDLIYKYTNMIKGTVFIGKKTQHVFVKGEWGSGLERQAYVDDYNERVRRRKEEKEAAARPLSECGTKNPDGTTTVTMQELLSKFKRVP